LKRSPLKRGKPLCRSSSRPRRTGAKRPRSKYATRERAHDYMLWVKTLPCAARGLKGAGRCSAVVEADHAGWRALGRKCSDDETIPLCSEHHLQRTEHSGVFRGWSRERMREWLDVQIQATQARYPGAGALELL
jgi:hypothetical protein